MKKAVLGACGACLVVLAAVGSVSFAVESRSAAELAGQMIKAAREGTVLVSGEDLRGREDVARILPDGVMQLNQDAQKRLLTAALGIGQKDGCFTKCFSTAVAELLVRTACAPRKDKIGEGARNRAVELLVSYFPDAYLRVHSERILNAASAGLIGNALLLGKTGAVEARGLLDKSGAIFKINPHKAELALAKLGDERLSLGLIERFKSEQNPESRGRIALELGYVGDAACVTALARDLRASDVYLQGAVHRSLRRDIVEALHEVYPEVPVFWSSGEPTDQKLDDVEKWLTKSLGVKWEAPRKVLEKRAGPIPTPGM